MSDMSKDDFFLDETYGRQYLRPYADRHGGNHSFMIETIKKLDRIEQMLERLTNEKSCIQTCGVRPVEQAKHDDPT